MGVRILCMLAAAACAAGCLAVSSSGDAALVVRISDLQYAPAPPNPIKICGRVSSVTPLLKLTDGRGIVIALGLTGNLGDFIVAEGDYIDGIFVASAQPRKATLYQRPFVTDLTYVPAGSFLMGNNGSEPWWFSDEFPQHSVQLSGYWIGEREVTRGEYRKFVEAGGYGNAAYWSAAGWNWKVANNRTEPLWWAPDQNWAPLYEEVPDHPFTQTDAHPVVGVSYYEAEAYCAWAGGHLPTEAQWEKAARWDGSYPLPYPYGTAVNREWSNFFFDHSAAGGGYQACQTAPVGSYPSGASPYGCLDMSGNVFEWCADWYGFSYYSASPATDPPGPASGSRRVGRGGSFIDISPCPCVTRFEFEPSQGVVTVGFRIAH